MSPTTADRSVQKYATHPAGSATSTTRITPPDGRQVASRARIRDGGGTAARPDPAPADGRSAPPTPHPFPASLIYAHNDESGGRRTAGHVNRPPMPYPNEG